MGRCIFGIPLHISDPGMFVLPYHRILSSGPTLDAAKNTLTYAKQMRTPLLLIHSEQDLRCPIEQAEQLFVQLRRIGKTEVEMVRFPEESHNLSRSGRPDRRIERLERIVGWFDKHM